jgi:hypothetical protein
MVGVISSFRFHNWKMGKRRKKKNSRVKFLNNNCFFFQFVECFHPLNVFFLLFTTAFCFGLGTRILEQEVINLAKSLGEWQAHSGYSTYAVRSSVEIKMRGFSPM